jgi:hypothetical protein
VPCWNSARRVCLKHEVDRDHSGVREREHAERSQRRVQRERQRDRSYRGSQQGNVCCMRGQSECSAR